MTEYQQAQQKWKEEIGFEKLQFPIYKKSADQLEWYRFDSINQFVFIKSKRSKTITVDHHLREALFVEICKWYQTTTADEFNKVFEELKSEIDKIVIQ